MPFQNQSIDIRDPDGSRVRIYDERPGNGAVIELTPASLPSNNVGAGFIYTDSVDGVPPSTSMVIQAPSYDAGNVSRIDMVYDNITGPILVINSGKVTLQADATDIEVVSAAGNVNINTLGSTTTGVYVNGVLVGLRKDGVSEPAMSAGSDTTTSASFVNMAGTDSVTSFSFTKKYHSSITKLKLSISATLYASNTSTSFQLAMKVGSLTAINCGGMTAGIGVDRLAYSGWGYETGADAGTYTIQARWRRVGGIGTMTRDAGDWLALECEEIPV